LHGIYSEAILFGLVCDKKLLIELTEAGRFFIEDVVEAPPYTGVKPNFVIEIN
jgi:TfoX/Sxy family transcriptional regulator of competence genes